MCSTRDGKVHAFEKENLPHPKVASHRVFPGSKMVFSGGRWTVSSTVQSKVSMRTVSPVPKIDPK